MLSVVVCYGPLKMCQLWKVILHPYMQLMNCNVPLSLQYTVLPILTLVVQVGSHLKKKALLDPRCIKKNPITYEGVYGTGIWVPEIFLAEAVH